MSDIVVENLNFSYDKQSVLENINFTYKKEDFLSIIGPNGGGKSTFLKLLLGLLEPTSGTIQIFQKSPKSSQNTLAYVPQNTNIAQFFPINCLEVALMGRLKKNFSFYNKNDKNKAYEALEKVGVAHLAKENISDLSGGQRQRVFIARALCTDAKIMLLDEPTASIDTNGQIQIYKLLKNLNSTLGIIVVSHDINVATNFANKILYINRTMHMHENENKISFIEGLKDTHLCPFELIKRTK